MLKPVDKKTLRADVKARKINAPIYSAIRMADGSVQIVTRNGIQTWKPPARKRKTQTPQRTRGKARTSAAKSSISKDDITKSGGTT